MYETFIVLDSAQQVLAKMPAPPPTPLITGDAVSFGVLMGVLGLIFYTSSRKSGFWAKFYSHIPALLLCYFVPGLLSTFHIIGEESASHIYHIASRYLLPAALFLLTLSIDIQKIIGLGSSASSTPNGSRAICGKVFPPSPAAGLAAAPTRRR